MKPSPIRDLLAVMFAGASAAAWADEGPGFYVGGGLGLSHYEDEQAEIKAALGAAGLSGTVDTDNNALGWKLFGGYRFNTYFGAELGYVDLGEESADILITGPILGSIDADAQVSGVSLTGTVGYPVVPQGYVFGKLGGFLWDSDVDGGATLGGSSLGLGDDDDGLDLTFGVGATYELVEHFKVRAEWERFNDLGDDGTDVDLFSGGIQYDF
ncbi:MAG: outer membrane beta-barrel protein [Chromatiales bacterium]